MSGDAIAGAIEARGVFVSHDEKVAAWINDEDHLPQT